MKTTIKVASYILAVVGAAFLYQTYKNYRKIKNGEDTEELVANVNKVLSKLTDEEKTSLTDSLIKERGGEGIDEALVKNDISEESDEKPQEEIQESKSEEEPPQEPPQIEDIEEEEPEIVRFEFIDKETADYFTTTEPVYDLVQINHYRDLEFADEEESLLSSATFSSIFPVRQYNVKYRHRELQGTNYVADHREMCVYEVHEVHLTHEERMEELEEEELSEAYIPEDYDYESAKEDEL